MIANADITEALKGQFNRHVELVHKRPGIFQVYAPLFHEDGDMLDIFIEPRQDSLRICDFGMTLMRLSYNFELDTENKQRIFRDILSQNGLSFDEPAGNIYVDSTVDMICPTVLQFAQTIGKVSRLDVLKREIVSALFFEMIDEFIESELREFNPAAKVIPIAGRDELEVPWAFMISPHPVYLFPVRNEGHARLATIAFLELQRGHLNFKGYVAHEDLEALSSKDRKRVTSAADKQFISFEDFQKNAKSVLQREAA